MFIVLSTGVIINVLLIKFILPGLDGSSMTELVMNDGKKYTVNLDDRMRIASYGLGGVQHVPAIVA